MIKARPAPLFTLKIPDFPPWPRLPEGTNDPEILVELGRLKAQWERFREKMAQVEKRLRTLEPYQEIRNSMERLNRRVTLLEAKVDLLSSAPRKIKAPLDWRGCKKRVPRDGYYEVLISGEAYRICRTPYGWRDSLDEIMNGIRDFIVNNIRKDPYVIITGVPLLQTRFRPFCTALFNEISRRRQKKFQVILIAREGLQAEMRKAEGGALLRWAEPESHGATRIQEVVNFL